MKCNKPKTIPENPKTQTHLTACRIVVYYMFQVFMLLTVVRSLLQSSLNCKACSPRMFLCKIERCVSRKVDSARLAFEQKRRKRHGRPLRGSYPITNQLKYDTNFLKFIFRYIAPSVDSQIRLEIYNPPYLNGRKMLKALKRVDCLHFWHPARSIFN